MTQEQLELYHQILRRTARDFDRFCRERGLRYYAAYGTALGAVRHHGFIPWDDDMDVFMLREDYDRLIAMRQEVAPKYEIIDAASTVHYMLPYAKFCDANSTLIEDLHFPFVEGVFIDIFPLDRASDKTEEVLAESKRSTRLFTRYARAERCFPLLSFKGLIDRIWYRPMKKISYARYIKHVDTLRKLEGKNVTMYTCRYYDPPREILPGSWFGEPEEIPFEDFMIMAPHPVHDYLVREYGDYMTPPPPEKRVLPHHHYYLDLTSRSR